MRSASGSHKHSGNQETILLTPGVHKTVRAVRSTGETAEQYFQVPRPEPSWRSSQGRRLRPSLAYASHYLRLPRRPKMQSAYRIRGYDAQKSG
jgi:hypothetical protein